MFPFGDPKQLAVGIYPFWQEGESELPAASAYSAGLVILEGASVTPIFIPPHIFFCVFSYISLMHPVVALKIAASS